MEDEDRLSSLPDDILHSILHGLPLKHAARTTALSRRWAPLWLRALASSPALDFTDGDFVNGQTPARAAATVQRCLGMHGPPLDAFRVALPSGEVESDVIAGWVVAAVARGAREVEVDLTPPRGEGAHHLRGDQGLLQLPGDVFLAETSLTRLSLDRFSGLHGAPPGLAGLRSLSLSRADVTDEALHDTVSNCPFLDSLSLRSCHLLTTVRIAGDKLRRLELVRCPAVRELRVAAPALEAFAFHGDVVYSYLGDDQDDERVVAVDLGATPALRDAYLSHIGFGHVDDANDKEYAYSDLLSCVAHAQTLTLCSVGLQHLWAQLGYDETVLIDTTNVRELQLLMASLGADDLEAVSSFFQLMQLPVLDRLFIRLPGELSLAFVESGEAAVPTGKVDDSDIYIYGGYDFLLDQLRLIKVVNFRGTRLELVMLAFLIKRASILEHLVVVTVDEGQALGDDQLKIIQGQVLAMKKASPDAHITVCRPSQDRSSQKAAHTRFYHEE